MVKNAMPVPEVLQSIVLGNLAQPHSPPIHPLPYVYQFYYIQPSSYKYLLCTYSLPDTVNHREYGLHSESNGNISKKNNCSNKKNL